MQSIDSSCKWQKMRTSLGSKRKELSGDHIAEITRLFGKAMEVWIDPETGKSLTAPRSKRNDRGAINDDVPISRIFKTADFGYRDAATGARKGRRTLFRFADRETSFRRSLTRRRKQVAATARKRAISVLRFGLAPADTATRFVDSARTSLQRKLSHKPSRQIGARKKPLVNLQAAFRVEDNGLEQLPKTPCFSDVEGEAAQNAAQLDPKTRELLRIWATLDDTAKSDLLSVARGLASRDGV